MRARGLLPVLLLNVIVSMLVAFGVIVVFTNNAEQYENRIITTVEVIITATPDPDVTPQVIVITATPGPGEPQTVDIPGDALASAGVTPGAAVAGAFSDSGEGTTDNGTSDSADDDASLPPGCILHTLQDGEFPSSVAEQYGANFFELMAVNNLDDASARNLRIGQTLIVPLDGCPIEAFVPQTTTDDSADSAGDDADEEADDESEADDDDSTTATATPTPRPTVALPPTAQNSAVTIVEVISAGDITREGVVIRNDGMSISISGWTLRDSDDNEYVFGDFRLFGGAGITIFTRDGNDGQIEFFWGLDQAIFQSGDVLTLIDTNGVVQASFRVP